MKNKYFFYLDWRKIKKLINENKISLSCLIKYKYKRKNQLIFNSILYIKKKKK